MKIALIGRPNVGKSSIFNRLVGRRLAIVDDQSGVTRDRRYGETVLGGCKVSVIDTPGVDYGSKNELARLMNQQSLAAVREADLVLLVIDSRDGITPIDKKTAEWLRVVYGEVGNRETIVVANKCENSKLDVYVQQLGFGDSINISAEHNINMLELVSEIVSVFYKLKKNNSTDTEENKSAIKIAIAGRPNVGKSTLLNAILGEERVVTGDLAGITRDSISVSFKNGNQDFQLIDTAGQRRKSKINEKLENVSVLDAWRYIKQVHAVIVVVDANQPFESQDLNIARKVVDEGKIVVFAVNKIDTIKDKEQLLADLEKRLTKEFAQVPGIKCIGISALNKTNTDYLLNVIKKLYNLWTRRLKTNELNRFLSHIVEMYHPPLVRGMPIKIKYISQTSDKPPAFTLFASRAEHLPDSYQRYILNKLRENFKMYGIPIRLNIRSNKNPYKS